MQDASEQAEPLRAFMQTEAGKAAEPTQQSAGANRMESIDRPSLTAPHHNVKNARPVDLTTFQGVNIEGGESQVKRLAANPAR